MNTISGQCLTKKEWRKFYPEADLSQAQKIPALSRESGQWCCQRCRSKTIEKVPAGFFYCTSCLVLGRMDSECSLYFFDHPTLPKRSVSLFFNGILSAAQKEISDQLVERQSEYQTFLLWAVTGAGKTEMLFSLLKHTLENGQRVAVTAPRIDVCNEIYLRFQQAFPDEGLSLYHGQERKSKEEQFVVCTTHQLLRYHHFFDLVIVDEVDAFPYAKDPLLQTAVQTARKETGRCVYLSATPDEKIKASVDLCAHLPARYHRRKLPVPKLLFIPKLEQRRHPQKLCHKLSRLIQSLMEENDVLIFCPSISLLEQLSMKLAETFPESRMTSVYSKDEERLVKVEKMRQREYQLLLTTTILERGVTFERVSVIVLHAQHRVFSQASLVQIAGRADRKGTNTNSQVVFVISECTKEIKGAVQEIKQNNQFAYERGLIDAL